MISQVIECEESGKVVKITAMSARKLKLTPAYKGGEVYKKGKLVELDFDGEFSVKAGDIIPVKNQRYRVHSITKMKSESGLCCGYHLNINTLNKASIFAFPFLGRKRKHWRWNNEFINCFISTEEEQSNEHLYLWYKYIPTLQMEAFEAQLKSNPNFVSQTDVDQYHVLYKFSVPKKFLDDYKLILEGKYSYISDVAKERILDFHDSSKERPLGKILNRDPTRRKKMEKELGVEIPKELDLHDPFYKEDEHYFNSYKISKSNVEDHDRD